MADTKLKNGKILVNIAEEEVVWKDRKRVTIFALPWSFTRYSLTPSRIRLSIGLFSTREDEVRLYRVKDVSLRRSFFEKINGTGTLVIVSNDASVPNLELRHIKNSSKVKDIVSQFIEVARRENGVHTSELIGGGSGMGHGHMPHMGPDGEPCSVEGASLGPQVFMDADGDGVPDNMQ